MALTATGRAALVSREALKTTAYKDSVGVWTIGVGHTSAAGPPTVTPGLVITQAEALEIFARDLVQYEAAVDRSVTVPLADHERDALVSICYNIGPGGFRKSTFVKRLNAGDRAGCAAAIMSWRKPPEIISRRTAERDQFLTPYSVALPKARSNDRGAVRVGAAPAAKAAPKVLGETKAPEAKYVAAPVASPASTPWWRRLVGLPQPAPADARPGLAENGDTALYDVQKKLKTLGYEPILLDGLNGRRTRDAVRAARERNGMSPGDKVDAEFKSALPGMLPAEVSEIRTDASDKEVAQRSPELFAPLKGLTGGGLFTAATSAVVGGADQGWFGKINSAADQVSQTSQSIQDALGTVGAAFGWIAAHWWIIGIVAGLWLALRAYIGWLKLKALWRQGRAT